MHATLTRMECQHRSLGLRGHGGFTSGMFARPSLQSMSEESISLRRVVPKTSTSINDSESVLALSPALSDDRAGLRIDLDKPFVLVADEDIDTFGKLAAVLEGFARRV